MATSINSRSISLVVLMIRFGVYIRVADVWSLEAPKSITREWGNQVPGNHTGTHGRRHHQGFGGGLKGHLGTLGNHGNPVR